MKVLTDNKYYGQIADIVREQTGTNNTYKPSQMVSALKDLFYEEVEGVPPISFNGIGENLLDYKIDGAVGGVGDKTSNLFDINSTTNKLINASLIEQDNNDYRLSDYIAIPNEGLNISGFTNLQSGDAIRFILYDVNKNIIERLFKSNTIVNIDNTQGSYLRINYNINNWDMSNLIVVQGSTTPENYEPYGYKVPVVISGKNLFNEITYQGAVNNSANIVDSRKRIRSEYIDVDENETYTCSSNLKIRIIYAYNNEYHKVECIYDEPLGGKVVTFVMPIGATKIMISFMDADDPNNEITPNDFLWGQLEKGSIATDYEPYHEPTITNIYLDSPIYNNESISLSNTNVNIPTIRGTNVLTVDTTVQPSNVYVKSRHESSYETAIRENYEQELSNIESALEEV